MEIPGMRMAIRRSPLALIAIAALFLISPADAQKGRQDLAPNDPSLDPYTKGDPEVWKGAGIVSMGGFEFSTTDTAGVDDFMVVCDIKWIETEHFELGFALGSYKVTQKEKKKLIPELIRLSEKLPEVSPKKKVLDPWLRAHLFAQRMEDIYQDFLEIVQLDPSVFPDGSAPWNMQGRYMGEGPYLGQKGKYEVLILPSEAASVSFLSHYHGLQIKKTQRWNVVERESMTLTIHVQQGFLKVDTALHGHVAFNLAINFYDGLRHYSYDTPVWIREGLAHFMERRICQKYNTFDGSEGSIAEMTRKSNWEMETRKMISSGKHPRMAELIRLEGYGDMELPHHYATWSILDYLHRENPDGLAMFLQELKGRVNSQGYADGSNMAAAHRELFKEHLGMGYAQFDEAWVEWIKSNY
jgi:hypothetical protein